MSRKTKQVTIDSEGRDKGKTFVITEMPARKAEAWAMRALLAISKNSEHKDGTAGVWNALATDGLQVLSKVDWQDAEPLLNELMECVRIIPDPTKPHIVAQKFIEDVDIEEISTRMKLKMEVWNIHFDFLTAGIP